MLDLGTDSTAAGYIDGLVRLTANSMTTGVGMHISSEALTTGDALHITSGSGSSLTTGSLVSIEANSQDEALVVVDLSATAMKTGTLLKVTNSGSALSSGGTLETTETGLTNAVFDITANTVENDRIVRISSNSLTSGAALEIVATVRCYNDWRRTCD